MSITLNPTTRQKLEQFGRRRRRLVLTRGVCSAIVSFLALMSVTAAADWLWVLPDALRWSLSAVGYAGAVVVVWLSCLRLMIRIPTPRELARRVEVAQPQLRENLLSAIELSGDDVRQTHDSPVFRRLLQDRVGRQMAQIDVRSLLPVKLLGRWIAAAVLILVACIALLSVPGLPFRLLLMRAILPGANIDRISRVQVTILQPTPHSLTLPQEETVAVVVEVSGAPVDEVTLEAHTETGGVARQQMRASGPSRYAANLGVGAEPIDYRILAGDAVTRKYTIRSSPRPSVTSFHKTYNYPQYTGLEDLAVTEPHGDLIALEGTEADLVLELDQDVARAEIRLASYGSEETETLELEPDGERRLRVALPVREPGIYRVHLVARETGFENTFSPKYEIRPEPDLIPRVGFVDQQETTLLLPPNDILSLEGLAEDDLPLVRLEQHVSVNGQDWQKTPLDIEAARRVTAAWDWDLLDLNLKSGDRVTTKLAATDRKGNTGESIPLQIVVSSPDFDPRRHAVMELKAQLYDKLAELADTIEEHQASAKVLTERLGKQDPQSSPDDADRTSLADLADKIRGESDLVFKQIVDVLPKMPHGADAHELDLVGRVVARLQHEYMRTPDAYLETISRAEDPKQAAEDLQRVQKSFDQTAEDARRLEHRYRDLTSHNILAAVALDLDALLEHQHQLLAPGTPQSWQRLLRQETVAVSQIHILERLIRDNVQRLASTPQGNIPKYLDWARTARERLEAATESEDQIETLRKTAAALLNELEGRQNADTLDSRLPANMVEARKEMDQRAGSLFAPLEQLARSTLEVGRFTAQAAESNDSTESSRLLRSARRAASHLGQLHFPGVTRLRSRKTLTQSRSDSDSRYGADAGLTVRAVDALFDRYKNESPDQSDVPEILALIAPAYRILESGHEAVQIRACLDNLLSLERWNSQNITSRLDHPRQWDVVQSGLESVSRKLKEAKYPAEITSRVDGMRWSTPVQDAARKITSRRYRREAPAGAVYELLELQTELDAVLKDVEPIMAEARALIAQYAPTIPEMARRASDELGHLEQETTEAADALADSNATEDSPQVDELQEEQRQIDDRIEDLIDALVEDANVQDLLTEEGRQHARDADDGVAMVEAPAARMEEAMQQAAQADRPADQARELDRAAEQQDQTAQALDKIAEHFERLESGQDVTETRNALRQAEEELGIAQQMDQRYDQSQQLGEMADKSLEDLLAELEAKLQTNPAMQEGLSEISRDALQQAKHSLEYSAEQEEAMRRAIERSAPDFQAQKKLMVQELRDIAEEASSLGRNLVARADYAAAGGEVQPARKPLGEAQQDLNETAAKPRSVGEDNVLHDIVDAARQMAENLENASQGLAEAKELTAKAKDEEIHDDEQKRAARQRDLDAGRQRFRQQHLREAQSMARSRAQHEKRVQQQVKSAQSSLQKTEKQVDQARQAVERDPKNGSAQGNLEQANATRSEAQAALGRAERELQAAQLRNQRAEQLVKQLQEAKPQPLEAANPAAELANRYSEEAAHAAEDLAQRAKKLASESDLYKQLDPDQGQLTQAATGQENIGQDVSQAGEDVARAGRHERRLGKPITSDQLTQAAQDIEQVAQNEVAGSERKLADAAAAEDSPPEGDTPDGNQQVLDAHASVEEAKQAIFGQAEALGEILNPPSEQTGEAPAEADAGQPAQAADAASQSSRPNPAEAAQGQLLARTLDELDQTMSAEQSSPQPAGTPQPGLPSLAQAASAQAAGMTKARMQSRQTSRNRPSLAAALKSAQGADLTDPGMPGFTVLPVNRDEAEDWGRLRDKSAQDLTEGRRESISAAYRERVETYFRVVAERARKKK